MATQNRRTDFVTSQLVHEALRFQRAFNREAAVRFLTARGHDAGIADQVLAGTYDRRQTALAAS